MKTLMIIAALCALPTFAQVALPTLPAEMSGCKKVETVAPNKFLTRCGDRAFVVQLLHVELVPDSEKREHDDLTLYTALKSEGPDDSPSTLTVRPKKVTPTGAVESEVFVERGDNAGKNLSILVLSEGTGIVSSNAAPAEYSLASTRGNAVRKKWLEWERKAALARVAKPDGSKK